MKRNLLIGAASVALLATPALAFTQNETPATIPTPTPTPTPVATPTPVPTPVPTTQPQRPVPTQKPAQQRSYAPSSGTGIGILERIKQCESGGNYQAQNRSSTASGAYQFLDSTWANYGGFAKARLAPPSVQDQKARETYNRSGTRPWAASQHCWGR